MLQGDPSPTVLYGPMGAFRYALEARDGVFAREGIQADAGHASSRIRDDRPG